MSKQTPIQIWVDRYVREELSMDETAKFETELLDSPVLQLELETALALREALLFDSGEQTETEELVQQSLSGSGNWQGMALAATVVLAVFSTVMFWKVSNDSGELQRRIDHLEQPRINVLTVPVNIMRSAGTDVPDVVVQKPVGSSAMLLDIELAPAALQLEAVHFSLLDQEGNVVTQWVAAPESRGRSSVLLDSMQVPAAQLWLEIATEGGDLIERRLLEFR